MAHSGTHSVAVVVASRNGERTIADTIRSAVGQADVYVVSDGSSDETAAVARAAGAEVMALEQHRRKLGKIVYVPEARAHIQDPTTMKAWYRQNVRWLWGTFQGIRGHACGRRRTRFDALYLLQMADWALFVFGGPASIALIALGIWWNPWLIAAGTAIAYYAWTIPAAI